MPKRKRAKKTIASSKQYRKGQEPFSISKIVRKRKKVPFANNLDFLNDKEKFNLLFKKSMPKYFILLRNQLKNLNRVEEIFKYADLYINGGFIIADIENMQMEEKRIRIPNIGARIARKK